MANRTQAAADVLWECWRQERRLPGLPDDIRPSTRADGYAVQAVLEGRSRSPLFGWKIAATSLAGQKHINVDGPLAGRLLAERVFRDGSEVPFGANHMRVAEAEFAFRMGRTLAPRAEAFTVAEVLDAAAALHSAIEIPDSRFDDFTVVGAAQLIADNACAHYFVLGPEAPVVWRGLDLVEHAVTGTVVGRPFTGRHDESLTHQGKGANVLGDPRVALTWLANELSSLRIPLEAGQVVTTGTCIVPLPVAPGDRIEMDFGSLGKVSCRIGGA